MTTTTEYGLSGDVSTFWSEFLKTRTEMGTLIPTAPPRADETRVGYYTASGGRIQTFMCPSQSSFWTNLRVSGDDRTFARCDKSWERIATECGDAVVKYTNVIGTFSATKTCEEGFCTTLKIYDYYDEGPGGEVQYMIDCPGYLQAPGGDAPFTEFYRTHPPRAPKSTDITLTTEASATTVDSTTVASTNSADSSKSSSPSPTANNDGMGGLSSGAIAGVVVGVIAGICLIGCGFYVVYRIGRQRRHDDPDKPGRSFMDSRRGIPRPNANVTWTQSKGDAQPPILQHRFEEDATKEPREMMGDTGYSSQRPYVVGDQGFLRSGASAVELPGTFGR
ncbi:hypothetical protein NCS52_01370100 [Fusarium sp. LHS14.1]|nr:hypothetical protein NCS52_01370100 [Fusarium sp. LHS14.1]